MAMNAPVHAEKSKLVTSEAPVTAFYLGKSLTGFVKSESCPGCKEFTLKITPNIKAYKNGKEVPLSTFVLSKTKPNSLVFERTGGKFVAMKWFSKS